MYSTFTSSIYFKILLSLGILSLGTSTEPDQIDRNERVTATTAGVEQKFTSPGALSAAMTFIVTTTADSGPGSLREAIDLANANAGADDITFSVTGTLTLLSTLPAITEALTITGSSGLTIASTATVFQITGGASDVVIQNMDMSAATTTASTTGGTIRIIGGSSNVLIENNNFANASGTAIDINNGVNVTINNNDFTGRRRVLFTIPVDGLTVTNNDMTNTGHSNTTTFQLNLTTNLLMHSNDFTGVEHLFLLQNFVGLNIDTVAAPGTEIVLKAADNYSGINKPFFISASNSGNSQTTISNLVFTAGSNEPISIERGNDFTISNLSIDGRPKGIRLIGSQFNVVNDILIECSTFTNISGNAISADGNVNTTTIENSNFSCIFDEVIDNNTVNTITALNNFYGYDADPVAGDFGGPVDFDPFLSAAAVCAPDGSASCAALVPSPAAALDFDGVNDHVNCGDLNALDGISKATIEVWANFDELSGNKIIVGKGTDVNNRIAIQQFGSTLFFVVGDGQNEFGGVNNAVSANTWHHIVLVFDGTLTDNSKRIRAYIDGVEQTFDGSTTTNFPATTNINAGNLIIGNAAGYNYFSGQLDEVRIWSSARTCEEINFYKDCELAGTEADLEAYYQFNQGDASGTNTGETILDDLTSNNNNGTLTGFATLTGSSSNWVAPGSVTTGNSCVGSPVFPEITVNNTLIGTQFGAVEVSSNADLIYTITNDGNGDLDISSISVDNGLFTVPTTVTSIAAGSTLDFTVTFAPTSTGTATGTVSIQSNDCDEDPYTFIVMAQGVCNASISNITATDEVCPGAEDGTITVNATCTTCTSIEYSIDGTNFGSANVFTNVAPGTYTVTIQDSGDVTCSATQSVTVATGADTENPSISCPADITTNTESGICQASVDLIHATGNDNCGDVTITSDATVDGVRYIRLTQNLAGLPLNLAELEAFQSGVNIAANATVTQSTNPGYPLTNFTDGDLTNFMHTINGIGQWVEVDLGSEQNLEYIRVHNRFDCCQNRGESLTLEYKDASNNVIESNNDFDVYEGVNAPHSVDDGTNVYQLGTTNITWTATDAAGNSTSCVQTITVIDNQNPTIECPVAVSQTVDTGVCEAAVTIGTPVTGDNCGVASITNDYNNTSDASDTYPAGTTMVIWTVVDDNGLINSCVQNVVITDDEAPIAHCAVNFTVNLDANQVASVDAAAINNGSADNCGTANVSITSGQIAYDCDDVGQTFEVTLTVDDGNATSANSTCSTMVTVGDADSNCCDAAITSIIPDANCPSTITVNAICTTCAGLEYSINGTDFQNDPEFTEVAAGNYTVIARDTNDPSCSASTSVTVAADTEAPSVTCGADISANTAAGTCEATVNWTTAGQLTFSDNCGINGGTVDLGLGAGPVAVTDPNASIGGTYPAGSTPVTYTISDATGLIASCSFNVVVTDDEDPTFEDASQVLLYENDFENPAEPITASDCGGGIDAFPGINTWYGTPAYTFAQIFTVEVTDINWPGYSDPSGIGGNYSIGMLSSAQNDLLSLTFDAENKTFLNVRMDLSPIGLNGCFTSNPTTPIMRLSVYDSPGGVFDINNPGVLLDSEDLIGGNPDPSDPRHIYVWSEIATGLDLSSSTDGNISLVWDLIDGGYAAFDNLVIDASNVSIGSGCPEDFTISCLSELPTAPILTGFDNCTLDPTVTFTESAINTAINNQSITRTWTVTDDSNNSFSCVQIITVEDNESPIITCPVAVTVSADVGLCTASSVSLGTATVTDNCTAITPTNDALPTFSVGTTPVTWTANDNNGQVVTCVQNVIVADNEAPIALCQDITVNLDVNSSYTLTAGEIDANSTDNCGISAISIPATTFDCDDLSGPVAVILTIVDNNNNSHTCTAQVTVADPLATCCAAPQASCQTATLSFQGNSSLTILPVDINAGSTADCGLVSMTVSPNTFNCADYVGSNLTVTNVNVTLTVEDINGATSACNTTVSIINDDNPPVFDCPANISVNNEPGLCTANITYDVTATDNCSTVSINQTEGLASGNDFPVGVTTNTFTANDVDNNSSTCSFTVTVIDTEAPTAVCQDITVVLEESGPSSVSDITISGTINQYAEVTAVGSNNVAVASAAGFGTGDKVLMIQMKGATIDLTNAATFGDVTAANEAGNYEYARIQSIVGSNITFISDLSKNYDPTKPVQLVRVPEYDNVIISGTLTAADWNGAIGGVLAFDAQGTVTLNANIDMKGKGFRGGNRSSNYYNGCENFTDYFIASPSIRAGDKGEGIADEGSAFGAGRGKAANGGGGGGSVNSGGGGGANYGAGGQGGREYVGCNQPLGGLGAATLSSLNLNDKIFLGGGGGGGQQNNSVSTNGADGGGIVLITANAIEGNGNQIIASGNDAINASNDGAGGGGAGGAVLLNVAAVNSALSINLTGGKGGNSAGGHGPAGGGGGGLFWHSGATLPANVTPLLNGGLNGTAAGDPFGTSPGQSGGTLTHLAFPGVTTISATTIVLTDVDAGSTDNCTIAGITLSQTEFGCEHLGPNPVSLTVIDVNGLSDACNAVITVVENTPPALTCPGDMTVDTEAGICEATVNFTALVSDNCDDAPNLTYSQNPGTVFSLGTTTVIVNATDVSTNNSSCSFDVTVVDNEEPTITCAANVAVNNDAGECGAVVTPMTPTFSDNCDGGMGGSALNLDGINDNVSVANGFPAMTELTYETWLYPEAISNWDVIMNFDGWAPGYVHFQFFPNGVLEFSINGNSPTDQFTTQSFTPNEWYHLAAVYSSTDKYVKFYINGQLVNTRSYTTALPLAGNRPFRIGSWNGNSRHFDGSFDDIRVWNYARTQSEIQASMTSTLNGLEAGLIAYYNFDDGTGCDDNTGVDMLTDFAGGDNGGQLNGFALDGSQTCQSNWTGGAPISTVSISNDFTGTADASGTYPIGTTTVTWTATDAAGLTSTCAQEVTVTDAEAPTAACTDITIDLIDRNTYSLTQANIDMMAAGTSDNCTGVTYAITAGTTDYDCDDRDAQFELTLTATDAAGLTNSCTATVTIADPNSVCNDPPIAVCQDITIFTGVNCDASIVAADVDGGSSDPDLDPLDLVIDHDGPFGVGTHTVILTVSDTEFSDNCTATITVQDNTSPTALCQDITVQLDAAGVATITTADINNNSTDACGIASLALDDTDFECKDIDAGTVVTLTVTDIHNNSSTCTANVTVEDNIDPVAVCQDITIQLDATGSASITPAQIDNGSSDACGLANNSLDVSTFSCLNVGTNNVILSVTDIHTNESSCTAIVTVEDKVAPVAVCQDLTIQLDASGNASISEDAVNDGSSDACNGLIFDTDITDFTCTNVGDNPVILTITDANNNSSTCTATITIEDKVAPIAICQDLTIQLDASGNASISEDAVNDGSNDACNGLTFDTDITAFACANVGDNPVILTITDANNNSSTCTATITIEDKVAPIAICQDLTVTLDATGSATITANDIDNGSNDACGIQDLVLDDYSFDCTDVGADQAANNYSLDFDGIDDWIDATGNGGAKASATLLGLPTQAITLEVYAYVNTFGIWKSFVSFIQDNGSFERGWDLETRTNGKFGFTLNSIGGGGALTYMETTNSFNLGQWYHIAGTYDGTTMKIYVDGVLENTSIAENGDIWYADSWLAMGVYKDDNEMNHLISGMDEVRIFDYAKTQAEIQATMSSTLSGIEPGLVAYYAFEDGPGSSTVTDLSGNGHDGVLLNMDPATDWVAGSTATAGTGGGALVNLTVTDVNGLSSSCAANVTVIDNTAPIAQCQDVSVLLDANGDANITVNDIDNGSSDACGIESLVLDETSFDCADVGENEVMFIATDVNNNADTCYAIVTVEDKIAPIAICQDITVQLDAGTNNGDGSVTIIPEDIDNGSNDACGILDLSLNISDFDCSNIGMNPVTLTVTDNNNNVTSCTAEVTVEDKVAPVISSCPIDQVLVNTPGDCSTLASWPIPAISDNCDTAPTGVFTAPGVNIVLNALGQFPVGSTTVTYTVKDDHNNETSCDFTITVTDIEPPTITSCPSSDIIVDNDAGLCEAAVDYGILVASDNCAGVIFTADTNHEIDGDIFAVGTTEVSFTATDAVGLQTVCSFNVTVNDTELPVASCEDITIPLDANGEATILADDVFVSATDNCQVDHSSLQVDQTNFACDQVGTNTVTVSIDDIYGNTGTCTATVTIQDNVAPIAICQDITVQLDANGNGSINTNDIDNGSNDACGLSSLSLDITDFACANVGIDNTVTLTVLDNNNNSSSCTAMVTVEDKIEPIALCQDVTVQLDGLGDGSITTAVIDDGSNDACGISSLSLNNNDFTCADVGNSNTVILTVTDNNGNISSCQSTVTVEDQVTPIALCQDVTIQLGATGQATLAASQIDNGSNDACGIDDLSVTPQVFTCEEVGPNTVTLTTIDVNGNQSTCTATVSVEDNMAPIALCQDLTIQLDAGGHANITAQDVDNGSNDACGIALLSLDVTNFTCTDVGTNTVTLTAVDNNDQLSTCTATITIEDDVAPIAVCQDLSIQLDATGSASITATAVDNGSSDACGLTSLTIDITDFGCNDVGTNNIVTLTVTDAHANTSTCTATITIEDNVAPVAICQDLTIQLDDNGTANITPAVVNNGSSDACGIDGLALDKIDFTCTDVGIKTVSLTVSDVNGNTSICTANITVEDNVAPVALCQDVTVQLDDAGNGSLTTTEVDMGSSDACGIFQLSLDKTDFSCAEVGSANTVILTVIDNNDNSSACTATVTVEDNIVPTALCQDVTVQLGPIGNVVLKPSQVDAGSNDACGIVDVVLDITSFDCNDIVTNNVVTLTATDANGNTNTCTATITVEDNQAPVASCMSATVQLDDTGNGSITVTDIDGGSVDNCGISTRELDATDFTCEDIGQLNFVTLTVTDLYGNVATCGAAVIVEDNLDPVADCEDIVVQLDATGQLTITPEEVDGGSNDACGVTPLFVDETTFSCADVGDNTVTLIVTDVNGNENTCTATVTVEDKVLPVANCQNLVVQLDDAGAASISPNQIDNGSSDACGLESISLDITDFSCANVGPNTVTLTVTDVNGNSSNCPAIVTVQDQVSPIALCQDITVLLDATGAISILATDIDNDSNDACGIGSLDLDISTFDCTHIDANTVTLTVTDNNSNVSTCTATVTVMDHVAPVAICQDLTIQLDATGTALVPATAVDNGSNDACGIADYSFLMGATELVTNGGFDTNNTGWTISGVHVTYFNSGGNPGGWLWLNGVGSGGFDPSASQVVSGLTIGQSYLINGSTRNHANCCGAFVGQAALAIDIDGVEQTTVNNPGTIWTDFSYSFTATSTSHTVGFRSEINGHDTDMAIDNISISGAAMSVASKSFDCTQVGPNVLSLQVTDNNGNTSTCQATVTIQDKVDPIALCQDVTIQLDANGLASITTTMMDAGSNDACGVAALSLDNTDFSCSDVGVNTVSLTVTDNNDNQSTCTANVTVEDNVAPLALCEDLTIQLDASGVASISTNLIDAGSNDACGIANLVLDDTAFDCTDIGANTVSLTVTDNHGNVATCSAQVTVQDNVMPVALCQDITIQLDASGVATITTTDIDAGSNDACGIANLTLDDTAFDCTDVGENTVTLTVTDNNTNSSTCTAVVTVEDNVAPIALCQNVTLQLDAAGAVSLSTIDVDAGSNDACGIDSVTLDNTDFTCADVGTNTVSLTVTDVHTNVSTCTATITVEDQVAPIALCQDVIVQLDAAGEGSITVADVDAGSSDACGFASLNLDATDFSCTDIGVNTVTLTTTDNNGNTTACTATVTVEDHVAPVASCQDVTIQLDANGQADITTATIDGGSTDACGLASISLDVTDFDCTNIGSNTVTMTVIDNNSNQSSCTATVTVEDKIAPIALCQDVTIQLNAAGAANISATDIDDGSNDACGIANLSLDITAFDCNDVGTNTVSLIVNDNNGNTTNCIATVTVEDNIAPIALCQDITVQLDNLGQAAILPQDLDNGSNDACGLIYQVDVATFDCADIDNLIVVALTVTDPSANSASCIAKVTVEDNIAPLALCQDLTIQLDAQGQASITEVDINANSSDACGIADLSLNLTDFSCADVGANTVTLTVTDVNANVSTCSAIVTVEDDIAPVASCKDVTITLDDNGLATLETEDVVVSPPGFANFVDSGQRLSRKRTEGLVLADFDSDGDLDAFTANYKQGNRVWLNNGAAHFNSNGQNLGRYKSCGIDAGDLDGDGDIDAFLGNYGQGNKVWLNNGNARFSPTNQNLSNKRSLGLKLGDLDGDGDLDAFVANDGQGNKVWLNNGRAKFSWRGQHLGYNRSHDVSLGDLDGDGDLDAFVANYGQGNRVWLNNGRGWFSATNQHLGWFESKGVELADLDGDGDLDAFVANEGRPNRIWLNNGSARFTDAGEYLAYNYSTAVALGDIDTDNDLDAFVTNRYQGNKTWLNGGGAAFSHGGQYLARNPSTDVKLGDLDGDGDLDAFVSNYDAANWIWLNNYDAGISDNCGITSIELSDEAFDCFDLGTHEVTVTVTDVHNNSSTCTATVTVLSQSGYDTADINNNGNLDDDCDGVADACDVCPGADDSLDSDNDGIPDCKDYDSFHTIPAEWRCGRNRRHGATKVEICHVPYGNPDNAHTICVSPHAIKSHLDHHGGDYLGPCFQITCGDNIAEEESEDNQDALQSDNQRPAALTDRAIFADSLATKPVLAIKLFPNPADHESFLDWRNYTGEPATVRIFNQLGQMVKEIEVDEITTPWLHLDLSTYQDGIYNVRVEIADYEPTTHKLVVTKRGRTIKP